MAEHIVPTKPILRIWIPELTSAAAPDELKPGNEGISPATEARPQAANPPPPSVSDNDLMMERVDTHFAERMHATRSSSGAAGPRVPPPGAEAAFSDRDSALAPSNRKTGRIHALWALSALVVAALTGVVTWAYRSQLETPVSSYDKQLNQLQVANDQLRAQFLQADSERQQLKAQLTSALEQSAELRRTRDELNSEIQRVRGELSFLRQKLAADTDAPRVRQQSASENTIEPSAAEVTSSNQQTKRTISANADFPSRPGEQTLIFIQAALKKLGFGAVKADGVMGRNTRKAIATFQRSKGLPPTGELDGATAREIENAANLVAQ